MPRNLIAAVIAYVAAAFELYIGVMHFPMAGGLKGYAEYAALSPAAMDFVVLLCLCVGLLLTTFGVLSLYFACKLRRGNVAARVVFGVQGLMFLTRTALEAAHPVSVPEPMPAVLYQLAFVAVLFLVPALLANSARMRQTAGA